jgi:cysteine desulfurase NifS/selenium donor protein
MSEIYLDYNATTPIDPRVAEAMSPYLHTHFGNPSSGHAFGAATKKAVAKARKQVADMLGCGVDEVVFTSGGSESNNYAIKGAAYARRGKGNHIITSSVEHPAVTEVCRFLERHGYTVTWLPVDEYGLVDPKDVKDAITPQTILVTVMHANNEVGVVEPVAEIAEIAHSRGILVHTDCAQSVGKIPVRVDDLGVDLLSIAGHKLYAPKGIGALYIRSGITLEKLIHGADHEMNLRAGTENVLEIVGLGEACAMVSGHLDEYAAHLRKMRDRLEAGLEERFPELRVNGHREKRLPNTLSVSFSGLEANTIVSELADHVAVSAGAACHADQVDVSAVLEAMEVPLEDAMGTIRLSTGRGTSAGEIDRALDEITKVVESLQPSGLAGATASAALGKDVKLTRYTHGLGCACKLRPQLLEGILRKMPPPSDERILVGSDTADDAAVFKISDDTAIVQTVDFFTPILDDPFQFGAVAAANSLSDIYAMGARPLFALNIVGFPSNRLPMSVLEEILRGAQSKADEAGISIIGGHTIDDTEPKYGMAVTGMASPDQILANRGAKPGDALVLTKPIGTGVLSTAMKQDMLDSDRATLLFETMAALNRAASELMQEVGAHACTDVTGFGLLGHLLEMLSASGVSADVNSGDVPFLDGVFELAASGVVPGGTKDNTDHVSPQVEYAEGVSGTVRLLLNDAQTSGGLLIAVAGDQADRLLSALERVGVARAARIGSVAAPGPVGPAIRVS